MQKYKPYYCFTVSVLAARVPVDDTWRLLLGYAAAAAAAAVVVAAAAAAAELLSNKLRLLCGWLYPIMN